jgi:hypothetical protein
MKKSKKTRCIGAWKGEVPINSLNRLNHLIRQNGLRERRFACRSLSKGKRKHKNWRSHQPILGREGDALTALLAEGAT